MEKRGAPRFLFEMKTSNPPFVSAQAYHDAITQRAREIWRARGRPVGQDVEIWLEAEQDLVSQGKIPASPPAEPKRRGESEDIDSEDVIEQLDALAEPPARSATSVDLTRSSTPSPRPFK